MKIFDLLKELVGPGTRFFKGVAGLVSIALGAVADPTGALNALIVRLIDFIALFWPSTPDELKIANLLIPATSGTSLGQYFIIELFSTIALMLGIVGLVKIYKLIPFKAT